MKDNKKAKKGFLKNILKKAVKNEKIEDKVSDMPLDRYKNLKK